MNEPGCAVKAAVEDGTIAESRYASYLDMVNGVDAVSYTHLRAHETVLDLVCRLLLEKKKKQKNTKKKNIHYKTDNE